MQAVFIEKIAGAEAKAEDAKHMHRLHKEVIRLQQKLSQRGCEILAHRHSAAELKQQLAEQVKIAQDSKAEAANLRCVGGGEVEVLGKSCVSYVCCCLETKSSPEDFWPKLISSCMAGVYVQDLMSVTDCHICLQSWTARQPPAELNHIVGLPFVIARREEVVRMRQQLVSVLSMPDEGRLQKDASSPRAVQVQLQAKRVAAAACGLLEEDNYPTTPPYKGTREGPLMVSPRGAGQ